MSIKFIDLYAGIGGFRLALETIGAECVFTSEIDKFARRTYAANFDGDVSGAIEPFAEAPNSIPDFDLLTAGFPCQPFSIGGQRKGFADTRGTAFHKLVDIIEHHRPAAFLLENVQGLTWHDGGRTWDIIQHTLQTVLGYELHARVIDSSFWVPQRRKRIFMVGFRRPSDFNFGMLEIPDPPYPKLRTILETYVPMSYQLPPDTWRSLQKHKDKHRKAGNGFGYSVFTPDDVSRTLSARYHKDGSEILISDYKEATPGKWEAAKRAWENGHGWATQVVGPESVIKTLQFSYSEFPNIHVVDGEIPSELEKYTLSKAAYERVQRHQKKGHGHSSMLCDADDVSPPLLANYAAGIHTLIKQTGRPRVLTPRECARLMGFPDWFQIPVSKTQAYRQFGNAVVVPTVKAIVDLMEPHL